MHQLNITSSLVSQANCFVQYENNSNRSAFVIHEKWACGVMLLNVSVYSEAGRLSNK